jgi:predicted outer membrane repeat protein
MCKKGMTILLIAGLITPAFAGTIYFVDDDAAVGGDGLSWNMAFNDLQLALDIAQLGDEIRVAGGIYIPSMPLDPIDPLSATFQLVNGVAVRGGFAGDGANPDARDFAAYESVLTGDLGGSNQAYHVVSGFFCDISTTLDGVTVTSSGDSAIAFGRLTLKDCTFTDNHAINGGALVFVSGTLKGCKFIANSAVESGGAMWLDSFNDTVMTDCFFTGNSAGQFGGAIEGLGSINEELDTRTIVSLTNCVFTNNDAGISGGAIRTRTCTQSLMGCAFVANRAPTGCAVYVGEAETLNIVNCTLAGNVADNSSAIACDSDSHINPSTLTITNCILWDGGAEISNNDSSAITVSYSDIQGGWAGTGNINTPPMFVRSPSGTNLGDLHLTVGSPCVNTGNSAVPGLPPLDLDGTLRIKGPAVDMGVYELAEVIPADMEMFPRILYKNSFFRWVTASIGLPSGYDVASINVNTIAITKIERLCCPDCPPIVTNLQRDPAFTPRTMDCDWDGIPELVVKFKRQDLLDLLAPGFYKITVSGMLQTAEPFQGSEIICVLGHCM